MRAVTFILAAAASYAATPTEYFPLQAGNQWVYRGGSATQTVVVGPAATFDGQSYLSVEGFDGTQWLRPDPSGALYLYDPAANSERIFMAADGGVNNVEPCGQSGRVVSSDADYSGPIGTFKGVVEIRYDPGRCADAGIVRELYLPYVGLLQRTVTTIAGSRDYDLIYARVGGVLVVSGPETSLTLALDSPVYAAGAKPLARIALRHTGASPLTLQFPSGQRYDVAVRNELGRTVYRWSDGVVFTQAAGTLQVQGEQNWLVPLRLPDLPPGAYTAEAVLTTGPRITWAATVPFAVR